MPGEVADRLAEETAAACPLLHADGSCRAWNARPAICRMTGQPWRDVRTGFEVPDSCRLDSAMAGNPPVAMDFSALDAARHDLGEVAIEHSDERVFPGRSLVAAALLAWAGDDAGRGRGDMEREGMSLGENLPGGILGALS